MRHLSLVVNEKSDANRLVVNVVLGAPATNGPLAADANAAARELVDSGVIAGRVILIYGRTMVPVAGVLGHCFAHVAKAVLFYAATDNRFVCAVNHDGSYPVGSEYPPEYFGLTPAECGYRPPAPKPPAS